MPDEFSIKLTLYLGEKGNIWKIMTIKFLCSTPADSDYEGERLDYSSVFIYALIYRNE